MPPPRKADSNLFAINYDAIESTLREANAPLLKRCADLVEAFARAPDSLALDEDVVRARRFAGQLDDALREARKARLSDGRPFRQAAAGVKAFFDDIDKPLKEALQAILDRLTEAAERSQPRPADAAILAACRKHLGDHGAQALAGVVYREVAQAR